ncbi:MAG: molybdopterin biosynthesis protein [Planctomycetota bacterium]
MKQQQFLRVVTRDEAEAAFRGAFPTVAGASEPVPLPDALGRVLAADVQAAVNVPGFVRANMDGFAVRAADTFGASEEEPRTLALRPETAAVGRAPAVELATGEAMAIATGAMLPRGADAVVMVEDTDAEGDRVEVRRAVAPGTHLSSAGSDLALGETVLHRGALLTSRDTGVLAALGATEVDVVRRPRVRLFSTGDELVAPGEPLPDSMIYDCNGRVLADAVREAGADVVEGGILRDDAEALRAQLDAAVADADLVLFSGGTSKGAGDLCYRMVAERGEILVHGVALKPGKPIVLARVADTPVVLLPGFPTSAVFTFHEFVSPWLRARGGRTEGGPERRRARLAKPLRSQRGRREYDLVHLVPGDDGLVAWSLGKGSGSITTFARADGFHAVPEEIEIVDADTVVDVTLIGPLRAPDLTVIGSHCTGLDRLLAVLHERGWQSRIIVAGSQAGVDAARRRECDVAGIHLLDESTNRYNESFVPEGVELIPGYGRRQGVVTRDGSRAGRMVNRNRGAGTRILIDRLLDGARPDGYDFEVRSHQAVAAAVQAGSADWGVCIENVARDAGLAFEFLAEERFDFLVPASRRGRAAVEAFVALLQEPATIEALEKEGFTQ